MLSQSERVTLNRKFIIGRGIEFVKILLLFWPDLSSAKDSSTACEDMNRYLTSNGCETQIITNHQHNDEPQIAADARAILSSRGALLKIPAIYKKINSFDPDLIILLTSEPLLLLLISFLSKIKKMTFIRYFNSSVDTGKPGSAQSYMGKIKKWVDQKSAKSAKAFFVTKQDWLSGYEEKYLKPVVAVPNPMAKAHHQNYFEMLKLAYDDTHKNGAFQSKQMNYREIRMSDKFQHLDQSTIQQPVACIIIDTEEDFNWSGPYRRKGHKVESVWHQYKAHKLYDPLGIKPTYLIDYPILANAEASAIFLKMYEAGTCALGIHLHPWTNPPYDEWLCDKNSFPNNLNQSLFIEKLDQLIKLFKKRFGFEPDTYKAGKYGIDEDCLDILIDKGLLVDTSIMPWSNYDASGGPNFYSAPTNAFWYGKQQSLLELPVSRGLIGPLSKQPYNHFFYRAYRNPWRQLKFSSILARAKLLQRIDLSPEGHRIRDQKKLVESQLKQGQKIFIYSYHSPSLAIENTPYVRKEKDLVAFLDNINSFTHYFINDLGGKFITPAELAAQLRQTETQVQVRPQTEVQTIHSKTARHQDYG